MRRMLVPAIVSLAVAVSTIRAQTPNADDAVIFTDQIVTPLPVNGRDFGSLFRLAPGVTTAIPVSGLFNTYFDASVGATIGVWRSVGSGRPTANGGWLQPVLGGSFQYDHFFGRDDIQVNTFNRNLQVDDADIYTGAITFGLENIRPVNLGFLCLGGGLTARAGAVAVDESPTPFDPTKRTGTPTFDYEDNGSLAGYRIEGWAAMKWRNDVAAFLKIGFGHDWTDAILGDTHSSGVVTISVGLEIPLAPRSEETPWSTPRRGEYSITP